MNIAILDLIVPEIKETRTEIRGRVEEYFHKNTVIPPVSYEGLFEFAGKLVEENGWDKKYLAFTMVCCGNAIWRDVVGAIPYNRRVLMLPQCLRNSNLCKAENDQLGLLCRECGECNISYFIQEAEKLGYEVLVTEGTTVTAQMIESGQIDAVIGVGCMEVLQKLFLSIGKYSIPGIGIPLLTCGCKDTLADLDWIKEEIHNNRELKDFRLLNFNQARAKIDSIFNEVALSNILGYSNDKTENIALKSLLLGGNRFRPFLTMLSYEAFCKSFNQATANRIAVSVECFHKASLIHDDIEDNDNTRYGKETIHAEFGVPIAINIGDLLIGEGYRLIAESELSPETIRDCLMITSHGHRALSVGQGAELSATAGGEIPSIKDTLKIFENKTAAAFKVSLLLGASAGGADKETLAILDKFSHNIGIAYQIKDDLSDYHGNNGDIEIRRFSILLSMVFEKVSEESRISLLSNFKKGNSSEIFRLIEQHNIQKETETLLTFYINEAKRSLENLQNLGLKIALHELVGKIFKDYL
ncbi:MAG: polyprenyl synthetase family protein [Tenuifilaceae bacterium]